MTERTCLLWGSGRTAFPHPAH